MARFDPEKDALKQIPLSQLLAGRAEFVRRVGHKSYYNSPFRQEETASFIVNEKMNAWKDHGHHLKGGDVFDLICDLHGWDRRRDFKRAKEYLKQGNYTPLPQQLPLREPHKKTEYADTFTLHQNKQPGRIWMDHLLDEVDRRGLPLEHVRQYVRQAWVNYRRRDPVTGAVLAERQFNTFAFKSRKGGWELNNFNKDKKKSWKNCIGPKSISVFPASEEARNVNAYVFTGFWDFLTWLHLHGPQGPDDEYIISNGDGQLAEVVEYLQTRRAVLRNTVLFSDHDPSGAGERARENFFDLMGEAELRCGSLDHLYTGIKDLSQAHIDDAGALKKRYRANLHREGPDADRQYYEAARQAAQHRHTPGPPGI